MHIEELHPTDGARIDAVAEILFVSFRDLSPDYLPTVASARDAVVEGFGEGRFSRVLLDDDDRVLGWAGGEHNYGFLWELHPLVVSPAARRRGCGRMLVRDVVREVAARGGLTLQVSTSDETDRTNLYGRDLYADPLAALRGMRSTGEHPIDFWMRVGFTPIGVMPDAEGPGKPSIYFAMRVTP